MNQYEITFIIDPVLPGDEIETAAKSYEKFLKDESCNIVHIDNMGLKQLAYPINKRNSGVYKCIEFQSDKGNIVPQIELAMRRDERIMRFLTIKLDKYGIKYNDDKRNGLIGKKKSKSEGEAEEETTVIKDDLTLIEGIDSKASKLLSVAGVKSYAALAEKSQDDIKSILSRGGSNYINYNPDTWKEQAQLAASGNWSKLNEMKDKIKFGESASEEE